MDLNCSVFLPGGGSFDDSDLMGVSNDGYKPDDGGRSGGRTT